MPKALPAIESLIDQKKQIVSYLLSKVQTEDWHGVADAEMDLREIDAQLELLQ